MVYCWVKKNRQTSRDKKVSWAIHLGILQISGSHWTPIMVAKAMILILRVSISLYFSIYWQRVMIWTQQQLYDTYQIYIYIYTHIIIYNLPSFNISLSSLIQMIKLGAIPSLLRLEDSAVPELWGSRAWPEKWGIPNCNGLSSASMWGPQDSQVGL